MPHRCIDRLKDWLASAVVGMLLALLLASFLMIGFSGIGLALGNVDLLRGIGEKQLQTGLKWLQGVPVLGSLVAGPLGRGGWRDLTWLTLVLFVPCLVPAARIGPILIARFDDEALCPVPPADQELRLAVPPNAVRQRVWAELKAWCHAGAGNGRSPLMRPWVTPEVPERFSLAILLGENSLGESQLVEAFARSLDRDDELAALAARSRMAGWRLKLSVKWHELLWWRARHARQPWDCGCLVEGPTAHRQLARFRPRRPTLIVAKGFCADRLHDAVVAFNATRMEYRHPVRLLVIDTAVPSVLALRFASTLPQRIGTPHCLTGLR